MPWRVRLPVTPGTHVIVCIAVVYIVKMKIHSCCGIEYFVETHICKLCDTTIARITGGVSSLRI